MTDGLLRTPLHGEHLRYGGKMVPFAGFEMPIQYPTGIQAEHRAVREMAGIFDVSHMGEFEVEGPEALALVQYLTVNDASRLTVGQAQYSAFCLDDGTVLDDLLIYRTGEESYFLVVNAGNREADWNQIMAHAPRFDATVTDHSEEYALLALQGPRAQRVLENHTLLILDDIDYYHFAKGMLAGVEVMVARTGYTGEDGFELYIPKLHGPRIWNTLLHTGEHMGLIPAGLGARDSLRLEVGYALYGNDLDREHTALESGLGWVVKLDKGDFIGREALAAEKERGVARRLVGLRVTGKGFPRSGYPVVVGGEEVGVVTSGTVSPTLGVGIALAYLPTEHSAPGTEVAIRVRSTDVPAVVERPPFYRDGSIRR